jgi:hypothetical protein
MHSGFTGVMNFTSFVMCYVSCEMTRVTCYLSRDHLSIVLTVCILGRLSNISPSTSIRTSAGVTPPTGDNRSRDNNGSGSGSDTKCGGFLGSVLQQSTLDSEILLGRTQFN